MQRIIQYQITITEKKTISAQRAVQVAEAEYDSATLLIKKAEVDKKLMFTDAEINVY